MRSALRMFLRCPGFSLLAAGTLALGIAAATVVFSFVYGVMLSPLPYSNAARLMLLWEFDRASQHDPGDDVGPVNTIAPADFSELGRQSHCLQKLDALTFGFYAIRQGASPTEVIGGRVTPGFFETVGVQPLLGRTFSANDPSDVAVLGYGLWQSQYGGDRSVVGRQVLLGDRKYTVLGVLPPEFFFYLRDFALWTPLEIRPNDRQSRPVMGVGLLRAGISAPQAQAEFDGIAARLATDSPDTNRNRGIKITGVRDQYSRFFRRPLGVLLISVGFLVLIGCANVGGLLLARAAEREREIAIRTALGATRCQIIGQLLAENLVIAVLAGAAGIAMALMLLPLARTLLPLELPVPLPGIEHIKIGLPVLLFTTVISIASVLFFGLAPSLRAAASNPGARASSPRAAQTRFLDAIVVVELGLSVLLLTGSGLTMRSVYGLYHHMGFHPDHVLTFRTPVGAKTPPQRLIQFYHSVLEGVSRMKGVTAAAVAYNMPGEGFSGQTPVVAEGANHDPRQVVKAGANVVSGDFFRTLQIPLFAGRTFTSDDGPDSLEVAVVSSMLARKLFSHVDPIGRRIRIEGQTPGRWLTVIGVAGDVRPMLAEIPIPIIYRPFTQTPPGAIGFVVRTDALPASLNSEIKRLVWQISPGQPITYMGTLENDLDQQGFRERLSAIGLGWFAVLGLVLSCIGMYALIGYVVRQRLTEFGIRMAVGATAGDLITLVLRRGSILIACGLLLGIAASAMLTRVLQSVLYGVKPLDPAAFACAAVLLAAAGLAACYVPARCAGTVNPMAVLRSE